MVNEHTLIGRIGADPEIKQSQSGSIYGRFPLATDKVSKGEKKTTWHQVWVFGRQAEVVRDHFTKGKLVYVRGSVDIEHKEMEDGTKRTFVRTLADFCLMVGGEGRPAAGPGPVEQSLPAARRQAAKKTREPWDVDEDEPKGDDGLPF
jgi:single-strand DNA-binding protein